MTIMTDAQTEIQRLQHDLENHHQIKRLNDKVDELLIEVNKCELAIQQISAPYLRRIAELKAETSYEV